MPVSAAYLAFRIQLIEMQSKDRVRNLVSSAVRRARNLPEHSEVDVPTLVARVARHKGLNINREEALQATKLVHQGLQLQHF